MGHANIPQVVVSMPKYTFATCVSTDGDHWKNLVDFATKCFKSNQHEVNSIKILPSVAAFLLNDVCNASDSHHYYYGYTSLLGKSPTEETTAKFETAKELVQLSETVCTIDAVLTICKLHHALPDDVFNFLVDRMIPKNSGTPQMPSDIFEKR